MSKPLAGLVIVFTVASLMSVGIPVTAELVVIVLGAFVIYKIIAHERI